MLLFIEIIIRSNALSLASFDSISSNPQDTDQLRGDSTSAENTASLPSSRHNHQQSITDLKEIDEIKRYEDFSTIDWVEDSARENLKRRLKIRRLQEKRKQVDREMGLGRGALLKSRRNLRSRIITSALDSFNAAQAWIVLTIIGCVLGVLAGTVNIITKWLVDLRTGHCSLGLYLNKDFCCPGGQETCPEWKQWTGFVLSDYLVYILFSVAFAFTSAFLVKFYAPYAAGSGISEIKCIIAGFVMNGFLEFPTLVTKSLALPLTIASGVSVGKEGPSVHYAACVGNVVGNMFAKYRNNMSKMREILSACTAAGVAVAFGSPMGGVLFSIEEVSSTFQIKTMWRSYFCALISTAVLASINAFRTGQIVIFSVSYDYDWHFFEIPFYVFIGLFGGAFGIFLAKWNLRAQGFRKKYLGKYALQEVVVLATITAAICYLNPILKLDMTESMQVLFRECDRQEDSMICDSTKRIKVIFALLFAIVIRTVLVIVSYGAKVPAGIFVPSMAIGAIFGRIVGMIVEALHDSSRGIVKSGTGSGDSLAGNATEAITGALAERAVEYISTSYSSFFSACPPDGPCITPGTYAFLGAAAALSGVLNITVTVVVIMYELTGALNYIVPTMIVVGVTQAVSAKWGKGGLTDQAIWFNGFPFIDTKEQHCFNAPVSKAMARKLVVLPARDLTLDKLEHILKTTTHRGFPIIDNFESKFLLGYIGRSELQYVINNKRAEGNLALNSKCFFARASSKDTNGNIINESLYSSRKGKSFAYSKDSDRSLISLGRHADNLHEGDLINNSNYHKNVADSIFSSASSSTEAQQGKAQGTSGNAHIYDDDDDIAAILGNSSKGPSSDGTIMSIDFEKYVNFTPICVRPNSPLETVMEIFSQMGPGVVLVDDFGRLCGLMSRKDILRYQFQVEHAHAPDARELDKTAAQQVDAQIWDLIVHGCAIFYRLVARVVPSKYLPDFQMKTADGTDLLQGLSSTSAFGNGSRRQSGNAINGNHSGYGQLDNPSSTEPLWQEDNAPESYR